MGKSALAGLATSAAGTTGAALGVLGVGGVTGCFAGRVVAEKMALKTFGLLLPAGMVATAVAAPLAAYWTWSAGGSSSKTAAEGEAMERHHTWKLLLTRCGLSLAAGTLVVVAASVSGMVSVALSAIAVCAISPNPEMGWLLLIAPLSAPQLAGGACLIGLPWVACLTRRATHSLVGA